VLPNEFRITLIPAENCDVDLEIWAAEQLKDIFQQVYGKSLTVIPSPVHSET
jgi:hypothetical protein